MKRASVCLSLLLAALALAGALTLAESMEMLSLTKTVNQNEYHVGDVLTVTLTFTGADSPLPVVVVDRNPDARYLSILTDTGSISPPAYYSETLDAVVWENELDPLVSQTMTFQMQVISMPVTALTTGHEIINRAWMTASSHIVLSKEATDTIRIVPHTAYLPFVMREYARLVNGDFERGLTGWVPARGPFEGHGTGMPQEGLNGYAWLGDPEGTANNLLHVGYGSISQRLTVIKPYLRFRYRVLSYDIARRHDGQFYDTFEVSVDVSPEDIGDAERSAVCGVDATLNPERTLDVTAPGLVFCGGQPKDFGAGEEKWDSGWKTVLLDLSAFQARNVTLYLTIWSREYQSENLEDKAWWHTWAYVDDIALRE